ncbi:MAG TPA: hypothetical protein VIT68_02850 [Candidatus Gracilibacteria bacterium]
MKTLWTLVKAMIYAHVVGLRALALIVPIAAGMQIDLEAGFEWLKP